MDRSGLLDGGGSDELGSATAELVVILPALFIVLTLLVQVIFWALASHAVQSAAETGGEVARAVGGTGPAGVAAAQSQVDATAGGMLHGVIVTSQELVGGQEQISVFGYVTSLLPGVSLHVSASSIGPTQGFRGSG